MNIILGGTGHVGGATAAALIERGEPVTIVTRDATKGDAWRGRGAAVAVLDVSDTDGLRALFRSGTRAFLLNPPADPASDTDAEEAATATAIAAALDGSGLEKIVVASTYGAQPGTGIGDLGTLHHFEQAVLDRAIPASIVRAAYYMTNWDALLVPAREDGQLPTMIPVDLSMPMVAPVDLGSVAADLMQAPAGSTDVVHVEGPRRYSPGDVAAAFAAHLGRPVEPAVTPRDGWEAAFRQLGFSAEAARSYARMTAISVDGGYAMPGAPVRGATTIDDYIGGLVARAAASTGFLRAADQ